MKQMWITLSIAGGVLLTIWIAHLREDLGSPLGEAPAGSLSLIGDRPQFVTAKQVEAYLRANGRNADSLIGSFGLTRNAAFLREAAEKFPDDPRVAFSAYFLIPAEKATPDERRQWLEAFQKAAPDNALPAYMTALELFRASETESAFLAMAEAVARPAFQDYTLDFIQNAEELARFAGHPEEDTKWLGSLAEPEGNSYFRPARDLGNKLVELAASHRQAGEEASAQAAYEMALHLGRQMESSPFASISTLGNLVGIAIQAQALVQLPPDSAYGDSGRTVGEQLNHLTGRRQELRDISRQKFRLVQVMSAQDRIAFFDRAKTFGTESALRWASEKYAEK